MKAIDAMEPRIYETDPKIRGEGIFAVSMWFGGRSSKKAFERKVMRLARKYRLYAEVDKWSVCPVVFAYARTARARRRFEELRREFFARRFQRGLENNFFSNENHY